MIRGLWPSFLRKFYEQLRTAPETEREHARLTLCQVRSEKETLVELTWFLSPFEVIGALAIFYTKMAMSSDLVLDMNQKSGRSACRCSSPTSQERANESTLDRSLFFVRATSFTWSGWWWKSVLLRSPCELENNWGLEEGDKLRRSLLRKLRRSLLRLYERLKWRGSGKDHWSASEWISRKPSTRSTILWLPRGFKTLVFQKSWFGVLLARWCLWRSGLICKGCERSRRSIFREEHVRAAKKAEFYSW